MGYKLTNSKNTLLKILDYFELATSPNQNNERGNFSLSLKLSTKI